MRYCAGLADVNTTEEPLGAPDTPGLPSPNADEATPDRPDASSKAADTAFNQAVVNALALQLVEQPKGSSTSTALSDAKEMILAAGRFPHARHLLLLALLRACHISDQPSATAVAILTVMIELWADVKASAVLTGDAAVAVSQGPGVPTAAHFKQWNKTPDMSHAAVLQQVLLAGFQHVSSKELEALPGRLVRLPIPALHACSSCL